MWYRVKACPECSAVWAWFGRSFDDHLYSVNPSGHFVRTHMERHEVCQGCGFKGKSVETTASWSGPLFRKKWRIREDTPPEELLQLRNSIR